ncbi:hypothetical protein M431DRAFT_406907 [Trichoderma harzianum CBS 226.95]|uniref:Uncharacterized protein n=1 Tax=Trichoderma harzianum CBS 226.95 TaxID=983964 RepID=A0A2T4AF39_TRIHA|nr:hypothetical protein M431DRAFT_406907 [Trichoderma harzianum CBS 226.95]PTB55701.1 hypothetical protein M431DRAFT_406907 [Trichoderma harzianum CBS 226.95]
MIRNMLPWQCKENTAELIHYETPTCAPEKKIQRVPRLCLAIAITRAKVVQWALDAKLKRVSAGAGATSGLPGTCRRRPAAKRHPDYRTRDPGILFGEAELLVLVLYIVIVVVMQMIQRQ